MKYALDRKMYKGKDGIFYPVYDAEYDSAVKVTRKDIKGGVIDDPFNCAISCALKRKPGVLEAYVGQGGVAIQVLAASADREAHAVKFTIKTAAKSLRDKFDKNMKLTTETVLLGAPSPQQRAGAKGIKKAMMKASTSCAFPPVVKKPRAKGERFVEQRRCKPPLSYTLKKVTD
jgi:hypothetical protein